MQRTSINWRGIDGKIILCLGGLLAAVWVYGIIQESTGKSLLNTIGLALAAAGFGFVHGIVLFAVFKFGVLLPFYPDLRRRSIFMLGGAISVAACLASWIALDGAPSSFHSRKVPSAAEYAAITACVSALLWAIYCWFILSRVAKNEEALRAAAEPNPKPVTYSASAGDGCFGELFGCAFGLAMLLAFLFVVVLVIRWMWEKAGDVIHR